MPLFEFRAILTVTTKLWMKWYYPIIKFQWRLSVLMRQYSKWVIPGSNPTWGRLFFLFKLSGKFKWGYDHEDKGLWKICLTWINSNEQCAAAVQLPGTLGEAGFFLSLCPIGWTNVQKRTVFTSPRFRFCRPVCWPKQRHLKAEQRNRHWLTYLAASPTLPSSLLGLGSKFLATMYSIWKLGKLNISGIKNRAIQTRL